MEYSFLENSVESDNIILPESDKINPMLLKNNNSEIVKIIDFLSSEEQFLYVHGFLGTGKRQIINYASEFLNKDVIKLEYYCKPSTVCDDILLAFIDKIEKTNLAKAVNINVKISTLAVKFQQYLSSIKKPFLIIIHSLDDIIDSNLSLVKDFLKNSLKNSNAKVIVSTKALKTDVLDDIKWNRKLFIKAFSKEVFKEYLNMNKITFGEKTLEDFYKYTRGYYYYTALTIKIIQAMKIPLNEFMEKFILSGMNFDTYLGVTYINLIPQAIRNFFWFLRTIRHGVTLNALAVWDLYDEFAINYLTSNLMVFQADETLYVQDYFQQNIDISIPEKTEIKLHKYIISIYEKELKESLQTRSIMISRQAMRAEIEFHNKCAEDLKGHSAYTKSTETAEEKDNNKKDTAYENKKITESLNEKIQEAEKLYENDNVTGAIEALLKIIDTENLGSSILNELRHRLGAMYKQIADYSKAKHYYELVEKYFKYNNELINLNYLYYEMTQLYYLMYKNERAIETAKKVIYSVDTPQSLMVAACTLLGNIYADLHNYEEAYMYYQRALESLDENISESSLAELYFKYALANDDRGDEQKALEYYNKCISMGESVYKSPAYSNLGSCYYENGNLSDAKECFKKAYDIEKSLNNFDGIYYTSTKLAQIAEDEDSKDILKYLTEAKQSAEFLNENSYILDASVALGDYYYNQPDSYKEALKEYFNAMKAAQNMQNADIDKIEKRIEDMSLRMSQDDFEEIEKLYDK